MDASKVDYYKEIFAEADINEFLKQEPLGLSASYDRHLYDKSADVKARSAYKYELFAGRKTRIDYFTGKRRRLADTQMDHIMPIKNVYDSYKDNPFLTDEDLRAVINERSNLRDISVQLNTSKGAKSNLDLIKENPKLSVKNLKLAGDAVYAGTVIDAKLAGRMAGNSGKLMARGAVNAVGNAEVLLAVDVTRNMFQVAQGDMSVSEAVKNTAGFTGVLAASGAADALIRQSLKAVSLKQAGSMTGKLAGNGYAVDVLKLAGTTALGVLYYLQGEIDGSELFNKIWANSSGLMTDIFTNLVLPPPYGAMAAASMVVASACGIIMDAYGAAKGAYHQEEAVVARAAAIEQEALQEMQRQREILQALIAKEGQHFDQAVAQGLEKMMDGILANDVEIVAQGLDEIAALAGGKVKFATRTEFDHFFDNPETKLEL
jgi:hypothetical protein